MTNIVFKDFETVSNGAYIPVVKPSDSFNRKIFIENTAIVLGASGAGTLCGFAVYKPKETKLLSDLEKDTLVLKENLTTTFESKTNVQDCKKRINSLQQNIDKINEILSQKKELEAAKVENMQNLCKKQAKELEKVRTQYCNQEELEVLQPLNKFVDERMLKIKNTKQINLLTGLGIGILSGVTIIFVKHFCNKKNTLT